MIGVLSTPTRHERTIPAEYDLSARKGKKILVLVEQPIWLEAEVNFRYQLTNKINDRLIKDIKFEQEQLVSYDELSRYRSTQPDFSLLSPVEVGKALEADFVLLVVLNRYKLNRVVESNYYNGLLDSGVVLLDVVSTDKLWPVDDKSKIIKVGFDAKTGDRKTANNRLVDALTHCIVRYLYNCPKDRFKIAEDRTNIDWENW